MHNRRLIRLAVFSALFVACLIFAFATGIFGGAQKMEIASNEEVFLRERNRILKYAVPHTLRICKGLYYAVLHYDPVSPGVQAIEIAVVPDETPGKYVVVDVRQGGEGPVYRRQDGLVFSGMGEAQITADKKHCYLIFEKTIYRKKK